MRDIIKEKGLGISKKTTRYILCVVGLLALISFFVDYKYRPTYKFELDLSNVVETGYGNTTDGDSMYWAIYEEWYDDSKRHLLYMNKETFDSLERAVVEYNKLPIEDRDSFEHGFKLTEDSEGLHICSIR